MNGRVFDGRLAGEIAPDDRARRERLKATARALVAAVRDGLVRDGIVRLHGFGTFRLKPVAARTGRHPRTGEPIDIPAGWRVMFRPAKALRERVEPERGASLPIGERPVTRGHDTSGAIAAAREAADRLPGEDASAGVAGVERSRAAAAAIPESKVSVRGPVPPTKEELEADSRVTRSPAALMRAPVANEPASTAGPAAAEESVAAAEKGVAATEEGVAATEPGRSRYRTAPVLLLLLLLLAIGLAWLFWPAGPPQAPLATGPEPNGTTTSVRTDDGAAGATGGTDTVAAEDGTTAVADGAEADAGAGDPDNASVRGDDTAAADSTPTAADDTEAPTADAGTTSDDGALTALSEAAGRETAEGATATGDAAPAASADESASAAGRAGTTPTDVTGAGSGETAAATTTGGSGTVATSSTDGAGADGGQAVDSGTVATSAGGTDTADTGTGTDTGTDTGTGTGTGTGTAVADPYFDGRDHTVRAGDTLWGLADRHYVNPFYWPHIWNHNGAIADPDRLEVRQGIWLPTLEGEPRALTAADRRSIAEGYLRLYRLFRSRGNANPEYALVGVRYFDVSVLPARLRDTSAGRPSDTLAAAFQAQLEAEFPLD